MRVFVMLMGLALAGTAAASDREVVEAVGARLTITYQCAAITGDHDAYGAAKADARARLPAAAADRMIATVEAQEQVGEPVTAQLCVDLLRLME